LFLLLAAGSAAAVLGDPLEGVDDEVDDTDDALDPLAPGDPDPIDGSGTTTDDAGSTLDQVAPDTGDSANDGSDEPADGEPSPSPTAQDTPSKDSPSKDSSSVANDAPADKSSSIDKADSGSSQTAAGVDILGDKPYMEVAPGSEQFIGPVLGSSGEAPAQRDGVSGGEAADNGGSAPGLAFVALLGVLGALSALIRRRA
jgi:hypothetical protein